MTETTHYQPPLTPDALAELAPLFDALAAVAIRGEVPGPELLARVAQARPALSERSRSSPTTESPIRARFCASTTRSKSCSPAGARDTAARRMTTAAPADS